MALLWYSSSPKNPMSSTLVFSSFYSVFLGFQGTGDFPLLPLNARAVIVAQGLVFSFFSHNFFLLVQPSWKSLSWLSIPGSPQVANLSYLVIFTFSTFLAALHSCHFSQIVWIFYCWVESSLPATSIYCFLIFGSLWYSSFIHECLLYTLWFVTAWLGTWDPIVLLNLCDLI